jgi:HEAT repeat protein
MTETSESVQALIGHLQTAEDWRVRRRSALRLAAHRETGVFEALREALSDRDPDVRQATVLALGRLGDPRAVELLCRPWQIDDPAPEIRWATVTALGQLGSLAIASSLSGSLDDPEWVVRNQALLAMSDFIRRIPDTIDGEQIKGLIRLLAIPDAEVRGLLVDALARRSTRGLDEMVAALHQKSEAVRAGVAEALGLSQDPRAVAPLEEATRDRISTVRFQAARGLGRLKDASSVEALVVLLGDSDAATSQAAIEALVTIGEAAVPPLCTALEHTLSKPHRRAVILTLGGLRDPRGVIPLLNNLSSSYYVVRRATVRALSAYGDAVVDELLSMVESSEVPIAALLDEALSQQNKRLRLRAVRALGEIKSAAAIKPLHALMQGSDIDVAETTQEALSQIGSAAWSRHGAAIALGNIGNRAAVPALIQALGDPAEYARTEVVRALGKLADPRSVERLIEVLRHDEDAIVRRGTVAALRRHWVRGRGITKAFRAALSDTSWEVRAKAARALGRIDDEASVEPLLAMLEDSSYTVRTSAENALANLGPLALPRLFETASGPEGPRLRPALQALAESLGEELRPGIAELTPEERREHLQGIVDRRQ